MEAFGIKALNYHMAKSWNETMAGKSHSNRRWRRVLIGRMPGKLRPGPGRSKGGGIDWYRFVSEVLEPILLSDYYELRRQRPRLMLILNGAAAHVSRNCVPFYEGWEINHLS
jgi:hypothetical protein